MVATFQQQSGSPASAASYPEFCSPPWSLTSNAASALAEPSASSWLDDPKLVGSMDWHSFYAPWQPAAGLTAPLAYRSQGSASLMGLVQQVHLSSVAEQASLSSLFGSEQESANDGISISSTNNQTLRSATGSTTRSTTRSASIEGIGRSLPRTRSKWRWGAQSGRRQWQYRVRSTLSSVQPYSMTFQCARLDCPHKATSATGRPRRHTPSRDTCDS